MSKLWRLNYCELHGLPKMKLLHTSDLHLGKRLYEKDRSNSQAKMLDWLVNTVKAEHIDAVVIAGDVFDTANPPHQAQTLYFGFLHKLRDSCCRHVIIVGGNHDSPTFLNAPRGYLLSDGFIVLGEKSSSSDDCFLLKDKNGKPEAVICAIPYLREKDIEVSDDIHSMDEDIVRSTRAHYQNTVKKALELRGDWDIPLIATGHLFAKGSKSEHGEVELYIGSLGEVPASIFPKEIDYLALGHLHRAQNVGNEPTRNYSGSPMPFTTAEAHQKKSIKIVEFEGKKPIVKTLEAPDFDHLEYIEGTLEEILKALKSVREAGNPTLVEIYHKDEKLCPGLVNAIKEAIKDSVIEILRIRDASRAQAYLSTNAEEDFIEEMNPFNVFDKRLESVTDLTEEDIRLLKNCYQEVVREVEALQETNK